MITYSSSLNGITPQSLIGFWEGWPTHPTPEKHLEILKNSDEFIIACDEDRVVGFITAITDKVLSAYIPLLEVLPEYRNKGVGQELVSKMIWKLGKYYMIDLSCDENLEKYYEKFGMKKAVAMTIRNYENQAGKA